MTGAIRSIRENSFQLYHAMSAAEPAICRHCTTSTNATSCTPARTLSMSEVNRLMMRPNFVWLKNDIGMVISLANKSDRMSCTTASPSSSANRWRKWNATTVNSARRK